MNPRRSEIILEKRILPQLLPINAGAQIEPIFLIESAFDFVCKVGTQVPKIRLVIGGCLYQP